MNEYRDQTWRCKGETAPGGRNSDFEGGPARRSPTVPWTDELNTVLGFARSICHNQEIAGWTEQIQKTLFRLGSALATPPESHKPQPVHHRGRRGISDPVGLPD